MSDSGATGRKIQDHDSYLKSYLGRAEIGTRSKKLPPALRSILLLVDGQRDVAALRTLAAGLHAPADAIEQLVEMRMIVPVGRAPSAKAAPPSEVATRYSRLSSQMSEAVRQHLGLLGFFTQLKIERCADVAELEALLPDIAEAVAKARSRDYARQWEKGVRSAVAT